MTLEGQIKPGTPFGAMLTHLATRAETIVEIGTWHGGGSTACFLAGMVRPTQRLWSIDCDQEKVDGARRFYIEPRAEFLWGCVSRAENTPPCPNVIPHLPAKIDLLLIDGGDEAGLTDLDALHDRCSVIALDDSNERKNHQTRILLKAFWQWDIIADVSTDRNGWAVFKRPS